MPRYFRYFVEKKNGVEFWMQERPNDIVEVANDIYKGHEEVEKRFPIPMKTLLELLSVFFRWMYKFKWTDHKVIKRSSSKHH